MQASGDGFWELDMADGSAWFSDWFCSRLQWRETARRSAFSDLRPVMSDDTWVGLLRKLRAHLEEQTPLDAEFAVTLSQGQVEWWQMRGEAQRNIGGHPTHLAGFIRDITLARAKENEIP